MSGLHGRVVVQRGAALQNEGVTLSDPPTVGEVTQRRSDINDLGGRESSRLTSNPKEA
jgi:hypothetical protein